MFRKAASFIAATVVAIVTAYFFLMATLSIAMQGKVAYAIGLPTIAFLVFTFYDRQHKPWRRIIVAFLWVILVPALEGRKLYLGWSGREYA